MKVEIKPIEQFADRIKQTLTATKVPTYDWMYEIGLSSTQLGIYAYIFDICKREPQSEHLIHSRTIADLFHIGMANVSLVTLQLVNMGLINKRVVSKSKCYYSIVNPNKE